MILGCESMGKVLYITLIGSFVGILGTGIGGMLALFIKKPGDRLLSFILGFAGGIMLTIVCFELLPEAFERGELLIGLVGIIIGVLAIIIIDDRHNIKNQRKNKSYNNSTRVGLLIGLGVALHNFPEGLAIGSGFMATRELGIGISLVIALHNIPEGISMATPMRAGGTGRLKTLLFTLVVGIPMGLGAFVGAILGEVSEALIAFCLAFAGGTMLYIVCGELIPNSKKLYIGKTSTWGVVIGFVIGLIITI